MQAHLKRHYGYGHSHFITCSCYRRQSLFTPHARKELFLVILEQWRWSSYRFYVYGEKGPVTNGYDVSPSMPEKKSE